MDSQVILVVPPILSVARPSLGISAMKASLAEIGCHPAVIYAALDYAEVIGPDLNQQLAEKTDHRLLVGDWIFAGCVSEVRDQDRDAHYLSEIVSPKVSPELLREIRTPALMPATSWSPAHAESARQDRELSASPAHFNSTAGLWPSQKQSSGRPRT